MPGHFQEKKIAYMRFRAKYGQHDSSAAGQLCVRGIEEGGAVSGDGGRYAVALSREKNCVWGFAGGNSARLARARAGELAVANCII